MTFHKSNLGSFGEGIKSDINGYVPDETTGPWDLTYDHGTTETHDDDGDLTEYGEWWETDRFPEIKSEAIAATQQAETDIADWQRN